MKLINFSTVLVQVLLMSLLVFWVVISSLIVLHKLEIDQFLIGKYGKIESRIQQHIDCIIN